jgi:hypothetical protein
LRDCAPIPGLMGKKLFSIAMINGKVVNPAFKMLETKDSSPLAALRAELHERFEPPAMMLNPSIQRKSTLPPQPVSKAQLSRKNQKESTKGDVCSTGAHHL